MKVLVTGSESSGKTTLARALAWCLDGVYVAEQSRKYLHALNRSYEAEDLALILRAQLSAEDVAVSTGASLIVCDTGPEVIKVWSEVKYGFCAPSVEAALSARSYDLILLCFPDLPWIFDPLRESPQQGIREALFARYQRLLPTAKVIRGTDRVVTAMDYLRLPSRA